MRSSIAKSSLWSLKAFCVSQNLLKENPWQELPPTSYEYLQRLGLPSRHPFCTNPESLLRPLAPPMGPASDFGAQGFTDAVATTIQRHLPSLLALSYLIAVLLAIYLSLAGVLYLAGSTFRLSTGQLTKINLLWIEIVFQVTLFLSWLVLTDDQYVLGIGRGPGLGLMVGLVLVATALYRQGRLNYSFRNRVLSLLLFSYMVSPWRLLDPDEIPKVPAGLYYNHDNPAILSIIKNWRVPDYEDIATPWQLTGDARTAFPYLLNQSKPPLFHRVWLPTEDGEYLALDIAFPECGHNVSNPIYLVLHGLNGGSREGYVMDLVASRARAGSTVVVLVARGLMDTPIQGWTIFNGIRTSDAHAAALVLRERVLMPNQTLAGVGYSMGGIVLNRYVATHPDVALDVSVSISGALNSVYQKDYVRSKLTWQRVITAHMQESFFRGKWGRRLLHRLGHEGYMRLLRAPDIVETDKHAGVLYNGYKDLTQFYTEMSSILAYPDDETFGLRSGNESRHRIPIPHAILQAMDDPISTWRSNAASSPQSALYPGNLVSEMHQGNIVLLLTRIGGHVGWPIGPLPGSWEFMNDMFAAGFISAYDNCCKKNMPGAKNNSLLSWTSFPIQESIPAH